MLDERGICIMGEMRKDRTPLEIMKKRAQEAEGELSIIKGMNRNEAKELQKKISTLLDRTNLINDIDRFHKKFGFEKTDITKKDTAGALDALVDIVYIALGTAWLFNLPFEKAWKEVQRANMEKIRAKDTTGKRGTKFDVIKPKNWKPPNIDQIVEEEIEKNENFNNRL